MTFVSSADPIKPAIYGMPNVRILGDSMGSPPRAALQLTDLFACALPQPPDALAIASLGSGHYVLVAMLRAGRGRRPPSPPSTPLRSSKEPPISTPTWGSTTPAAMPGSRRALSGPARCSARSRCLPCCRRRRRPARRGPTGSPTWTAASSSPTPSPPWVPLLVAARRRRDAHPRRLRHPRPAVGDGDGHAHRRSAPLRGRRHAARHPRHRPQRSHDAQGAAARSSPPASPTRRFASPSAQLAISPPTHDYERYLYAIDTTPGGVMVFDITDPVSSPHQPLQRPHAELNPFNPPDRIVFSAPVATLAFVQHDWPLPSQAPGEVADPIHQYTGLLCNPNPNAHPDAGHLPRSRRVLPRGRGHSHPDLVERSHRLGGKLPVPPAGHLRLRDALQRDHRHHRRRRLGRALPPARSHDHRHVGEGHRAAELWRPLVRHDRVARCAGANRRPAPSDLDPYHAPLTYNSLIPEIAATTLESFFPVSAPNRVRSNFLLRNDPTTGHHIPNQLVPALLFDVNGSLLSTNAAGGSAASLLLPTPLPPGFYDPTYLENPTEPDPSLRTTVPSNTALANAAAQADAGGAGARLEPDQLPGRSRLLRRPHGGHRSGLDRHLRRRAPHGEQHLPRHLLVGRDLPDAHHRHRHGDHRRIEQRRQPWLLLPRHRGLEHRPGARRRRPPGHLGRRVPAAGEGHGAEPRELARVDLGLRRDRRRPAPPGRSLLVATELAERLLGPAAWPTIPAPACRAPTPTIATRAAPREYGTDGEDAAPEGNRERGRHLLLARLSHRARRTTTTWCIGRFGWFDSDSKNPVGEQTNNRVVVGPDPSNVPFCSLARCCFHHQATFKVRTGGEWVTVGQTAIGLLHHVQAGPATNALRARRAIPIDVLENARAFDIPCRARSAPCRSGHRSARPPRSRNSGLGDAKPDVLVRHVERGAAALRAATTHTATQRDIQWKFSMRGGFSPIDISLIAGHDAGVSPQSMRFIDSLGQLAVVDGAQQGLVLIDLNTLGFAHNPYF